MGPIPYICPTTWFYMVRRVDLVLEGIGKKLIEAS